jgi:radical SAM-linked protein
MTQQDDITRIRVNYTKEDSLRFTGHLDLQRLWERTLRRSGLPIRYSQGFNPRARLNLASALPLGFISKAEVMDFWMNARRPLKVIQSGLASAVPEGIKILSVKSVSLREKSLQSRMLTSQYRIHFFDPQEISLLKKKINDLLSETHLERTRRNKTYDLRPLILRLNVESEKDSDEPTLLMQLKTQPGATGRPDEVMDAMGFPNTTYLAERTEIIYKESTC